MTIRRTVEAIQFAYPQIYYACHTRHDRRRSNDAALSARDSQILVHLDRARPTGVTRLCRHLGLAASTVSEAVTRLERFGYITKSPAQTGDRRQVGVALTAKGLQAVQSGSVLETARLQAVVRRLSRTERQSVARALDALARACRPLLEQKQRWDDA